MIHLTPPEKIFHFGISPSMVQTWLTCRRKWYNHYVRQLRTENVSFARFGAGLHTFHEWWFKPEVVFRRDKVKTLMRMWRRSFPAKLDFISPTGTVRTQDFGMRIIKKYIETYPRESEPFEVMGTEIQQQAVFPELLKPLNFKLDAVIKYRGGVWVKELKTSSRGGASFFKQFKLDFQKVCYVKGAEQILKVPVEGVFYDFIGTKKVVDSASFMRDDEIGVLSGVQRDYQWREFVKIANEMIQHVEKNWQDVGAFPATLWAPACQAFMTECPYGDVCEMCDNTDLFQGGQR